MSTQAHTDLRATSISPRPFTSKAKMRLVSGVPASPELEQSPNAACEFAADLHYHPETAERQCQSLLSCSVFEIWLESTVAL